MGYTIRSNSRSVLILIVVLVCVARFVLAVTAWTVGNDTQILSYAFSVVFPATLIGLLLCMGATRTKEGLLMRIGVVIQLILIIAIPPFSLHLALGLPVAFLVVELFAFVLAFIALQGLAFNSLDPFVTAGDFWFGGVLLVFLVVHIPALYLARWTAKDMNLPSRAALLAFGYGFLAFFVLPTMIMHAMGGNWNLLNKPAWVLALTGICLIPCMVIGLTAVQMFAVHGDGTPIPLDKTKRLVRSGVYAYFANPMQMSTAMTWVVLGAALQNVFIALGAAMMVVFVLGMVRWHHRSDLEVRFPQGWPEYREHVREWYPRWRPWVPINSTLTFDADSPSQRWFIQWLSNRNAVGITTMPAEGGAAAYRDGTSGRQFTGLAAYTCTLFHINFATTFLASAALLVLLPSGWAIAHIRRFCDGLHVRKST